MSPRILTRARPKGRARSASTTSGRFRAVCSRQTGLTFRRRWPIGCGPHRSFGRRRGPFPEALARVHAEFERIHPFLDGNVRAGRLLTNLLLIRMGYPPAIIRKAERTRYLRALHRADAGDHAPLAELLARAVLDTLMRFIVPAVAGPARLVPLAALATRDLSVRALRAAAERGRLRAQRDERGQWRSTRNWVSQYRKRRYQREA